MLAMLECDLDRPLDVGFAGERVASVETVGRRDRWGGGCRRVEVGDDDGDGSDDEGRGRFSLTGEEEEVSPEKKEKADREGESG